uniref:Secreted protein n=1 Tax=Cebus imitator TaxID=2715852 RepID=A0A2K5QJE5_CEBIM
MWLPRRWGSPRALMTLPSARRLLLIWMLSLRRSPVLPVLSTLSEPARSTKWNLETSSWPAAGWGRRLGVRPRCSRVTVKTVCERLDSRLRCVAPVCRAALPISRRLSTSSRPSTSTSFTPHSTFLTNIPTLIFPELDVTAGGAHLKQVSELLLVHFQVGHMH